MKLVGLTGKGILLAPILSVLLIFFIPISPTLKSIFLGCALGAILFTPDYNQHLRYAYNTWWGRAASALFVFIVIASFWSPAPYSMRWDVIGKYSKLLYLPIFSVVFINPKTRYWGINCYLAALFITCILSILRAKHLIHFNDATADAAVFYNHIITGFMVALAAYWAALLASQSQGWPRIIYGFLALLASYQILFINTGRTGYLIYFVLIAYLFFQKLTLKKIGLGMVLLSGIIALVYHTSPVMQSRVNGAFKDIKEYKQHNQNTSLGYRIQFHRYAKSLLAEHPVIGIGTGGFKYRYLQDNPVPYWGKDLHEPHSQYWMTLSEQGIVGMVFLLFFLGSLFHTSFKLSETNKRIFMGILISFCIGSLTDTLLCFSAVSYLLIIMSALCFGELIEQQIFCSEDKRINQPISQTSTEVFLQ